MGLGSEKAMNLVQSARKLLDIKRRFGFKAMLIDAGYKLFELVLDGKIMVVLAVRAGDIPPAALANPHGYKVRCLTAGDLARAARVQPQFCETAFVSRAQIDQGDECFAVIDTGKLASTGWYSTHRTPVDDQWAIEFDPRYVYMFKGYTHEDYRGQALHSLGMSTATVEYGRRGIPAILSVVEANNFASLKSCAKMGYRASGWVAACRFLGRSWTWASAGCRPFRFGIVAQSAGVPVSSIQVAKPPAAPSA